MEGWAREQPRFLTRTVDLDQDWWMIREEMLEVIG